jgi:hypothetical protein
LFISAFDAIFCFLTDSTMVCFLFSRRAAASLMPDGAVEHVLCGERDARVRGGGGDAPAATSPNARPPASAADAPDPKNKIISMKI